MYSLSVTGADQRWLNHHSTPEKWARPVPVPITPERSAAGLLCDKASGGKPVRQLRSHMDWNKE
jgi:hypothetical protein